MPRAKRTRVLAREQTHSRAAQTHLLRSWSGGTVGLSRSTVRVRLRPGLVSRATIPLYTLSKTSEPPFLGVWQEIREFDGRSRGGGGRGGGRE